MKSKLIMVLAAAAGLTACNRAPQPANFEQFYTERLEAASTLQDSIIAIDGSFLGAYFAAQTPRMVGPNANRDEILRGMRAVMSADTADNEYIMGVRMGIAVFEVYKNMSRAGGLSKEQFINTLSQAFHLDSITPDQLEQLQPLFQQMYAEVDEVVRKREDQVIYDTPKARSNRDMADRVAQKLMSDPAYKPVGNDGLLAKVTAEGDGNVINPNSRIKVTITERRCDTLEPVRRFVKAILIAGNTRNEVLQSVIPFMSLGETAEFFVPYTLAYGVKGNDAIGVGPCESLIAEVTVEPYDPAEEK